MKELNILLADDDKDDFLFFHEVLEELPLKTVLTAVWNGEELMKLLEYGNQPLPDMLFLDLNMPRKNGFSCLVEIRQCEKLKQLPVIIYSTSFDQTLVERLYRYGANHFICKPADFSLLKQVIHQAIMQTVSESNSKPPKEDFLLPHSKVLRW